MTQIFPQFFDSGSGGGGSNAHTISTNQSNIQEGDVLVIDQLPSFDYTSAVLSSTIDGQAVSTINVISATQIELTVPAGVTAGTGKTVEVTADGEVGSLSIEITEAPAVESSFPFKLVSSSAVFDGSGNLTSWPNEGTDGAIVTSVPTTPAAYIPAEASDGPKTVVAFNGQKYLDFTDTDLTGDFTVIFVGRFNADSTVVGDNIRNVQIRVFLNGSQMSTFNGGSRSAPNAITGALGDRIVFSFRRESGTTEFFEGSTSLGTVADTGTFQLGAIGVLGVGAPFTNSSNCTLEAVYMNPTAAISIADLNEMITYLEAL